MCGKIYDRVTSVISQFSGIHSVPKDLLKFAAERGTKVHTLIEGILKGFDFKDENNHVYPYIESFYKFWDSSSHIFADGEMILEKRLFCEDLGITGQMDVLVKTKDRTYLIDWKTSSQPQKTWALQGAAYKYLAEQNGYENVDSVLFVKLKKDGKSPTLHKHENHKENLDIFFKCLDLYRWLGIRQPKFKK